MFPSTGQYDRTLKRDKTNKQQQLTTTLMQKGQQQQPFNYNLPMDHNVTSRQQQQQLIEQQKSQLQLDNDKYFLLSIIKAHQETCDYTKDKVTSLIAKSRKNPIYARCSTLMSCPLNPLPPPPPPPPSVNGTTSDDGSGNRNGGDGVMEDFSERFSPAIRGVVEFAKRIPGFGLLSQDDQVTLLKAGVFEVLLVRLSCMFDSVVDSMICLNGMVLKRDSLHSQASARLLLDSMFAFTERLNGLNLTDSEIALFCSIVVISPDRPGLHNIDLVDKINRKCVDLLNQSIKANHHSSTSGLLFNSLINKITDLRTLNTLHSEKLLAYKMGPKNGQNYNNLSSSSSPSSPSPISSSSSSSSSSLSSLNHHNGNSNSSSNGDRNCNSPANMNTPSTCSYASLLPVQWQNFTIRDTNDGPTSSLSSSSRLTNHSNNVNHSKSFGLGDDDHLSSYDRNSSVTSSDHILITKSSKSANGLINNNNNNVNHYLNADYQQQHGHNNQLNSNITTSSSSPSIANHFILGQRLLQSTNKTTINLSSNNTNSNNSNSIRDKNHGSYPDSQVNSINHHHHQQQHQPHNHYDNYCNNGNNSSDVFTKMRRVDSPTDSGIESGKEQCNGGSTPTASVCSSPRSACDDKVKDIVSDSECSTISEKNTVTESIDDMPMLKRALQAPPLINTNMLMDEAYRHHKKFRATKASRDCEPASSSTSIVHSNSNTNNSNTNHCLASPTSTSSSLSSSTSSLSSSSSSSSSSSTTSSCLSSPSSNSTNNDCDSLASTHSTLVKVLESAPRYIGDLRIDTNHHHHQPTSRHLTSPPPPQINNYTSLKKCDLLHSLIMKGNNNSSNNNGFERVNHKGEVDVRVGDSMPPPLDLSRKRDLLYL